MKKVDKKEPDHRSFWVYVPIWNANLYVYVGGEFSKFQEWACKNTPFPKDRIYEMSRHVNSNATTYGWYGDAIIYSMTTIRKSVLVHELLHFTLQLLRHRDVDESDDEVRCYLLEWLYKEVVEKMPKEMLKEECKC